jgi:hypothetical protein
MIEGTNKSKYRKMDDDELIAAVAQCDANASEEFIRRYANLIWTIINELVPSEQGNIIEPGDLFHAVIEEFWKNDKARIKALHRKLQQVRNRKS